VKLRPEIGDEGFYLFGGGLKELELFRKQLLSSI